MARKNETDVGVLFLGICEVVNPRGKTPRFFNKSKMQFTRSSDLIYIYIYKDRGLFCFVSFLWMSCNPPKPYSLLIHYLFVLGTNGKIHCRRRILASLLALSKSPQQGNVHVSGLANFGPIEQKLLNLE
jgi:hypothetical protein